MIAMIALVIQLVEWAGVIVAMVSAWAIWHVARRGFKVLLTHNILENKESNGVSDKSCGCDPPCRDDCR
jgi:hypothetical protein